MTNRDVYEAALSLLAEEIDEEGESTADYEARAPYLLSLLFGECEEACRFYRGAYGLSGDSEEPSTDLDDEFPLEDRFLPVGAYYLAAMLVEPESQTLSDRFFARYADALAKIRDGLPALAEEIRDIYD